MREDLASGAASAKVILFGEHAVVYGYPSIALPVECMKTTAFVKPSQRFSLKSNLRLSSEQRECIRQIHDLICQELKCESSYEVEIDSSIWVSAGLGSSAAVSVALVRAIAEDTGQAISKQELNSVALKCEKIFHTTPSGIDNTVITFQKPMLFEKGKYKPLGMKTPVSLVIADSGARPCTKDAVANVKETYETDNENTQKLFEDIHEIVMQGARALIRGDLKQVGILMDKNQSILRELGVSNPRLEKIIAVLRSAGAMGAKLSGAGLGGVVIALVDENHKKVMQELEKISKGCKHCQIK